MVVMLGLVGIGLNHGVIFACYDLVCHFRICTSANIGSCIILNLEKLIY